MIGIVDNIVELQEPEDMVSGGGAPTDAASTTIIGEAADFDG